MYLTMNRFRVNLGQEQAFEAMWNSRDSHLKSVPGFVSFHLMRGAAEEGARLYVSHTLWSGRDAFEAWTRSEAFRAAHKGAKSSGAMYDGPPVLECFESVQEIVAT
ncbi:antibiotic biosynthesis monooxygenase [Roseibacterium sp. SDUM158017]|uniref:antibiotic biosynthesis monooxygenase family protein n=1 Tax=Roseicyclus salinarum TaxID=3036773 RepID=UPI0024152753|nr:antibiotic biosynthesis monooxygenase [Roseibacterium sp. SDUM158017]MDG4648349.1 antibiotic biosynthesis monooxygenase [Roseibacterium sp. SDUM158017]